MNCTLTNEKKLARKKYDGVVVVGMGGSGLAGDVLQFIGKDIGLTVPIIVSKDYELPMVELKKPLFVFSSFSGNTRETITALTVAIKEKKNVAVTTSGGEIERIARKYKIPLGIFETHNLTPREGLVYNLHTIIAFLSVCFSLSHIKLNTQIDKGLRNEGNNIAKKIGGRIPLIYTIPTLSSLGLLWKIFLNETAKVPAFANVIPEIAHNEIEGVSAMPKLFIPLFLTSKKITEQNRKKIIALAKYFRRKHMTPVVVSIPGSTHKKMFLNTFALALYTTTHIAEHRGISPHNTPSIDLFKKEFEG